MFHKHHPPVGSRPGTLVAAPNAVPPTIRLIHFTEDRVEERAVPDMQSLGSCLEADGVSWIDVQGLGDLDVLRTIGEIFSMHPLALEDVVNVPQRPKTEQFDNHQIYISRMVRVRPDGTPDMEQVSIIFGRSFVLTIQERPGDVLDPVRERIRQGKGPIRRSGPDYLAYTIIDTIIDGYYPFVDVISEELERLEGLVLSNPTDETLAGVNRLKRTLLELRRGVWPQRDAVNTLIRDASPFVSDTVRVYLRDCYDHCVQLGDVIDTYRELAAGLFSTYLSAVSNRTNDVMKVLTIMASIFIPLTFLAGVYGMNFEGMPELHVWWAYPALLSVMVLTTAGMLLYFRRRGWIGSGGSSRRDRA